MLMLLQIWAVSSFEMKSSVAVVVSVEDRLPLLADDARIVSKKGAVHNRGGSDDKRVGKG